MADATNENKRDLWLYDDGSWREGFHDDGRVSPLSHHVARPRADDDARPMVTGGGLIKFDRRADDASGAEAAACVAPAHDMAPRVVVEPYGRSEWRVWLHIGSASWAVGDPRHTKDAAERFAEPLRHALRAPLPATDDAVEEAAEELCDYLDKTSGGEEWKGSSLVRRLQAALRRAKGGA